MRARHALFAAGTVFIGLGFAGLITHASAAHPSGWAIWFAGGAVAHDVLLAPVVVGVAALAGRAPRPARGALRVALVATGSVTLVALPMVLGYGRRADNPSVLPQAYGTHLTAVIVMIGLGATAVALMNAYARPMGKTILAVVGVLLSIWLLFTVISMVVATLKFLLWLGLLAVIAAVVVTVISRLARSR